MGLNYSNKNLGWFFVLKYVEEKPSTQTEIYKRFLEDNNRISYDTVCKYCKLLSETGYTTEKVKGRCTYISISSKGKMIHNALFDLVNGLLGV